MSIASLGSASAGVQQLLQMRSQLDRLQLQLGTGKLAQSYAELGPSRLSAITVRSRLAAIEGYDATAQQVALRTTTIQNGLAQMKALADEQRSDNLVGTFVDLSGGRTAAQQGAAARLEEAVGIFNQSVDGRSLFSGRKTDGTAALSAAAILDGTGGRQGLRDVIAERRAADGVGGAGRLAATTSGTAVTLAKDIVAGVPVGDRLGFSVAGLVSGDGNVAAARTAGPPAAAAIAFAGQPATGNAVTLTLGMPDGRTFDLRLEATSGTPAEGQFAIGATPADTAANFAAAVGTSLQSRARTELVGASALAAADGFFDIADGREPLRVNAAGTDVEPDPSARTVRWYTGEGGSDDPRGTAAARVDGGVTVGYGLRATEPAFRQLVGSLATFAALRFDPASADATGAYAASAQAVRDRLGEEGGQSLRNVQGDIAVVQQSVKSATDRHAVTKGVLSDLQSSIEDVSKEDVAMRILQLQTSLQASYQTTSMLSQLTLVNFLR